MNLLIKLWLNYKPSYTMTRGINILIMLDINTLLFLWRADYLLWIAKKISEIVNPLLFGDTKQNDNQIYSHYVSDKGLMERFKDSIAEIKIGNKSNSTINELDQVLSILVQRKKISPSMRRDTFGKLNIE